MNKQLSTSVRDILKDPFNTLISVSPTLLYTSTREIPFLNLQPEKGTPFGHSLPVSSIIGIIAPPPPPPGLQLHLHNVRLNDPFVTVFH